MNDLKKSVDQELKPENLLQQLSARQNNMGAAASSYEDRLLFICDKSVESSQDPRNFPSRSGSLEALTLLSTEIGEIEVNKLLGRQGFCILVRGCPAAPVTTSEASTSTLEVLGYAVVSEIELSEVLIDRWKQGLKSHWNKLNEEPILLAISEFVILQKHREKGLARTLIRLLKEKYTMEDSKTTVIGMWPVAPRESELEFARTVLLDYESGAFTTWFLLTQTESKGTDEKKRGEQLLDNEEEEGGGGGGEDEESCYFSWNDWRDCGDLSTFKTRLSSVAKAKDWDIQTLCQDYAAFLSAKYSGCIDATAGEDDEGGGGGLGFQREFAEAVALLTANDLFGDDKDGEIKKEMMIETDNKSTLEHVTEGISSSNSHSDRMKPRKKRAGDEEEDNDEEHKRRSSPKKTRKNESIEDNLG